LSRNGDCALTLATLSLRLRPVEEEHFHFPTGISGHLPQAGAIAHPARSPPCRKEVRHRRSLRTENRVALLVFNWSVHRAIVEKRLQTVDNDALPQRPWRSCLGFGRRGAAQATPSREIAAETAAGDSLLSGVQLQTHGVPRRRLAWILGARWSTGGLGFHQRSLPPLLRGCLR
jgi:hypothetical protein